MLGVVTAEAHRTNPDASGLKFSKEFSRVSRRARDAATLIELYNFLLFAKKWQIFENHFLRQTMFRRFQQKKLRQAHKK